MYAIIEDGIVKTINVDKNIFTKAVLVDDDVIFGDKYENGQILKVAVRPIIEVINLNPTLEERVIAIEEVILGLL